MGSRIRWVLTYCAIVIFVLLIAYGSTEAVSTIAATESVARKNCIVIDAGHGGVDGGAVSCTGRPESAYNLEIALRLDKLICFLGYETRMIRETDASVYTEGQTISQKKISDLKERLRIVRETDGAVLISLHQNYFPDPKYSGAQVFYSGSGQSEELACLLQSSFAANLNPGSRRKAKKAEGIYLMEQISCTGVLIECGFLSNVQETNLLQDSAYQKNICIVIASGISQFLSNA